MNELLRHPDFFIVGAGKAGTTALWRYLSHHPGVYMTQDIRHKELGYYSDNYGVSDENKYLSFFHNAKNHQKIGESCHTYLSAPESPQRIFDSLPDAKIIIMLRDPVKRAYSLYNWMVMEGYEKLPSFKQAVDAEQKRMNDSEFIRWATPYYFRNFFYLHSGLYGQQVKPYVDLFGSNCRVFLFEEFNKEPSVILQEICDLLDIKYHPDIVLTRVNESRIPYNIKFQFYLQNDLRWKLKKIGMPANAIEHIIGGLIKFNTSSRKPDRLSDKDYNQYRRYFEEDIALLSVTLHKDLDSWWKY